jgi:2-phosphoglycerate kinase
MRLRRPAVQAHIVISDTAHGLPYSKGLMASSVMMAGVPPAHAYRVAEKVEQELNERGVRQITSAELRYLAASLLAEIDERHASTYLQWQAVEELDQPLIILLGGATGVGKSTIATQLAARLGITRVISTDAIREVLRAALSQKLIPTLYVSSFNADEALRVPLSSRAEQLIVGFQEQVTSVSVGIKALIARALEEGTDIIVEGAHVVPGFLEGWEEEFDQAVLVPVVIAVSDAEMHRSHFAMRALETRSRPRDRYLGNFEKIRALQGYILSLAEKAGAPVVEMFDLDSTLQQIAAIVVAKALEKAQVRTEVEPQPEGAGAGWPTGVLEPTGTSGAMESGRGDSVVVSHSPGRVPRLKSWELLGTRRKG